MTQDFKDMLYLLGWNHRSQINGVKHEYNVEKIKELAISQGVWTLVFPELEKHADLSMYLNDFMAAVSLGIQRNTFQLQVISDMNAAGLRACLLKGAAVALAYPDPSCRISGDTDILLDPSQEREVIAFLEKRGYRVEPRKKNDHHFKAYHPTAGLLEGHVRLYSMSTEELILSGLKLYDEEWTTEEIEGYTIPVLGLNDGLIYLTAHYIKHLVNEGGGVRQMLDLLLYIERYKDRLDFEKYNSLLKQLSYDKLVDVIKSIGAMYWGFDYPIQYEELADEVLTDSEEGGIFGYDSDERNGFYKTYCKKRENNSMKYKYISFFKRERGVLTRIFMSKHDLLRDGYGYAKITILMPVAWCHHMVDAALRIAGIKKTGKRTEEELSGRIKMVQKLGMIS